MQCICWLPVPESLPGTSSRRKHHRDWHVDMNMLRVRPSRREHWHDSDLDGPATASGTAAVQRHLRASLTLAGCKCASSSHGGVGREHSAGVPAFL